jgi:membrane protein
MAPTQHRLWAAGGRPARKLWDLLKETARQWYDDNTFQLGAALAYYTVFSLAPVVLIAIAVAGLVFGPEAARSQIVAEISATVGPTVGQAIESLLQHTGDTGTGTLATVVGVAVLLFGATSVFAQLQEALHTIWGVQPKPGRGLLGVLKDRFWSFAAVVGVAFLLLVSLVLSAGLAALSRFLTPAAVPGGVYLWQALNWVFSLVLITALFALLYRLLPDVRLAWGDVWVGAFVTAVLFTLGKYLVGLYLGRSGVTSAYGAAGSLVVILLWVYYSSQVFLFGAEFTQVYATADGKPVQAAENAVPVTPEDRAREAGATTKQVPTPAVGR